MPVHKIYFSVFFSLTWLTQCSQILKVTHVFLLAACATENFSMFLKKRGINNFTVTERLFLSVSANFTHIKTVKWFLGLFPQTSCNGPQVVKHSSFICTVEVLFAATFLGVFTKLQKVTTSCVTSACPPICMEKLSSQWMDSHEIWHWYCAKILQKNSSFIKIWHE